MATVALVGVWASGCSSGPLESYSPPPGSNKPIPPAPEIAAPAGMPVQRRDDPSFIHTKQVASSRTFGSRANPFALTSSEAVLEREQASALLLQVGGSFPMYYQPPPPPPDPATITEVQPYRRLAAIIVGDAVIALIEMEDGRTYEVRPGSQIPNSEWRVVSIDRERAILRRDGDKLPKEIVVRLESPPPGLSRGPGGNRGGAPTGGDPSGGGGMPTLGGGNR